MKKFLVEQKFRLDIGFQFWTLINFSLLIIAASDKILKITGIEKTWMLLIVAIPCCFIAVWLFGYVLDKLKYANVYLEVQASRNPTWEMSVDYFEKILKEIKESK